MFGAMAALSLAPASATYDPVHQFVSNGGFEQTTNGAGELAYNTNVVGWTSHADGNGDLGYNFVFNAATAASIGAPSEYGSNLRLWGPGNGAGNGLGASPTGGNFIGNDGSYHSGALTQQIDGLIVGQTYTLSFDFAGAQQQGYDGATTAAWYYGLANQFNTETAILANGSHGFTGWYSQSYSFVAAQASDTLYFFAAGTPSGQPPFSLLDSVSLTGGFGSAAPDPATWMTLLVGFGLIGCALRAGTRHRKLASIA